MKPNQTTEQNQPQIYDIQSQLHQWQSARIQADTLPRDHHTINQMQGAKRSLEAALAAINFWIIESQHILADQTES